MKIDSIVSDPGNARASLCRRTSTPAALALICLALPLGAAAEGYCSNATLRGHYGALIQGVRGISPPHAPLVTETFVGIALRNFDGDGGFVEEAASQHGLTTGAFPTLSGGTGVPPATGTYQVNPNCTGTSTLTLTLPPPPGSNKPAILVVKSDFVIVDNGKTINEIVTDPAPNVVTAIYTRQ